MTLQNISLCKSYIFSFNFFYWLNKSCSNLWFIAREKVYSHSIYIIIYLDDCVTILEVRLGWIKTLLTVCVLKHVTFHYHIDQGDANAKNSKISYFQQSFYYFSFTIPLVTYAPHGNMFSHYKLSFHSRDNEQKQFSQHSSYRTSMQGKSLLWPWKFLKLELTQQQNYLKRHT